ncbi:MAG: tRNA preQ1(34) S-adenosylmethionine ribosyltransferase-isomerase QueA [Gemmataceae bacterium]|nr:tRNA preQ1(34) S-adenosylmethionine ribosyltransferase-isomerase QueA [Gemmataceae bacterium]
MSVGEPGADPPGGRLADYDYDLPEELIAQRPAEPRDSSRLLVAGREGGLGHRSFTDLPGLLAPGSLLVMNDTRVVAARLVGRRARTGGKWEGLFVRADPSGAWEVLAQTRGYPREGEMLVAESPDGELPLVLEGRTPERRWRLRPQAEGAAPGLLARFGQVPIPPYIRKGRADGEDIARYQTLYARNDGAVAAPTAGLHFTQRVFDALEERGIGRAFVTLHVGPGTFQPVKADDVASHRVEPEWGEVPTATAEAMAACRARGGQVVAVGTTTTRVLESAEGKAWSGPASLTIAPPYGFKAIDALLTNFHLPRSSLLLLVAAFLGLERTRAAYAEAVARRYRFYSYGDAMLIR